MAVNIPTVIVRALGLHLRPREFIVAVKYRLGVRVYTETGPCTACGDDSDAYGDHAVECGSEDLQAQHPQGCHPPDSHQAGFSCTGV